MERKQHLNTKSSSKGHQVREEEMGDLTTGEFLELTTKESSEVVLCIAFDKEAKTTFCISSQNGDQFIQHSKKQQNFNLLENLQHFLSDVFHIEDLKMVVQGMKVNKKNKKRSDVGAQNDKQRKQQTAGNKASEEVCLKSRSGRKIKPPKWHMENWPPVKPLSDEDNNDSNINDVDNSESVSDDGSRKGCHRSCENESVTQENVDLNLQDHSYLESHTNSKMIDKTNAIDRDTLDRKNQVKCFDCDVCGIEFLTVDLLKTHKLSHNQAEYSCDLCGDQFISPKHDCQRKAHTILDRGESETEQGSQQILKKKIPSKNANDVILSDHSVGERESKKIKTKEQSSRVKKAVVVMSVSSDFLGETIGSHVTVPTTLSSNSAPSKDKIDALDNINNMIHTYTTEEACDILESIDKTENEIVIFKDPVTQKLACSICGEMFVNKYNLARHLTRKHQCNFTIKVVPGPIATNTLHSSKFSCRKCNESFHSDFERIKHELEVHDLVIAEKCQVGTPKREKLKCPICKNKRETVKSLKSHVKDHYEIDVAELTCGICKMQFTTKNRLQNHEQIHSDANKPCNICGKKFRTMKYVKRHIAEFHKMNPNKEIPKEKRFSDSTRSAGICDICGKVFKSSYKALLHRSTHNSEKTLPCPVCGKMFTQNKCLQNHLKTHKEARNYVCEYCGKAFKISQGLNMHKLRYHHNKEYKCDQCDRKFLSFAGKKYHMYKDHKEYAMKNVSLKKYVCQYCDRLCSGHQEYLRHLSIHVDNKDKFCDICNRAFSTVSQLNCHRKVHFAQVKRFSCKICNFKALTPFKLKRHLASSRHIESCAAVGITNVSVATDFENENIVNTIPEKNDDIENNQSEIDQSDADYLGGTNVVTIEMTDNETVGEVGEEVEVKYLEIPDNLEGSQIIYTDNADMIYSVIQGGEAEGASTYIFDSSVNQAVESILKLQKS